MPINRLWPSQNDPGTDNYQSLQNRIIKRALLILILGLMPALILRRPLVCLGFIFGATVSIFNFRLLARDIQRISGLDEKRAFSFAWSHFIFRYLILALALSMAMIIGGKELFFATFMGLILIKMAIFSFIVLRSRKAISE